MSADQGTVAAVSCNDTYAFTKPVRDEIVLVAGVGVAGDVHAGVHVKHRGRVRADPTQPNLRQVHLMHQEMFAEVEEKGYAVAAGNLGENVTTAGIDLLGLPTGTILRFGRRSAAAAAGAGAASRGTANGEASGGGSASGGGAVGGAVGGAAGGGGAAGAGPGGGGARGEEGGTAGPLAAVLEVAAATTLDVPTAASAAAIAAAVERDPGDDPRPAVIVAGLRNPCGQINGFRPGLLKEVVGRDDEGRLVRKAGIMAVVLRGGAIRPGDAVVAELPPLPHVPLERV